MKTAKATATAAAQEDDDEPRKIRSSRSKRRRARRSRSSSSSSSESPPRKRSKKHSKRGVPDKKSKRSKVSSSSRRHRRRSLSPSRSPSSSPSSVTRHSSSTSSSASERSVSLLPRSRSRDVTRKKGRGRDRERGRKSRKVRRSTSSSSTSLSSGSSRSRSRSKGKSRKRRAAGGTKDGATRDKVEKDYTDRRSSRSDKSRDDDADRDEEAPATIAKKGDDDIHGHKRNVDSEKTESPPSKNANGSEVASPAAGGANSDAEDLELILRKKALENFRKFRAAATMSGKTDNLTTTGKEASTDSPQNASTKIAEATLFQRQGSSLGMRDSAGSPRSEDRENGAGHSWIQESSAGMSRGAGSPAILEPGDAGVPTQQKGRTVEGTHSASQFRSPQDDRNSRSVMQRLVSTPGSSASVNQRLGTSAGVSDVSGAPRVRSVVCIPAREGLDGSTHTTASRPSEDSAPGQSSSEVGLPLVDINKAEGTNGENRKTSEASASNGSVPSPAEDKNQARIEDKDGFEKKTFSRMHDGETVEVSYKVYIPKKTPALARRKLQR